MSAYQKSSNPFEDDDDDTGYDFGGSQYKASRQNNSNHQEDRRQQIMRQVDESESRQLDSTRRALASIYESESMGVATAEELVRQGEQLDNIEKKTDTINKTLTSSQKHLNNIKSVFGGIKNWWQGGSDNKSSSSSEPPKPKDSPLRQKIDSHKESAGGAGGRRLDTQGFYDDDNDIDSRFMAGARAPQQQMVTRITNSAQEDEMDENLGLMSEGMSRLKGLALGLGDEIESQNEQLDRINDKTNRALPRLENQNKQMKKILHK